MIKRHVCTGWNKGSFLVAVALGLYVLGASQVKAQTTGSIYGRVSDSAGAAISGAALIVKSLETNRTRTATTNDEGSYTFTLLPVGAYSIAVEAQGFRPLLQENVGLEVEANLRLDFKLEVGPLTEHVVITGETPQVDTASSALGKVVEQRRIVGLPLNGRNFLQLGVLQAGVVPSVPGIDVQGGGTNSTPGGTAFNFSVNGMRISSNNHLLDGANNVEPISGAAMIVPSVDALQEFRILTNMYSAEFGRAGGSIVTVLTKSGTNSYHGSAYEFLRNDVFDARNFFAAKVPALKQNQFGATFGGRISKDRTFFFGSYEGFRERKGIATSTTVPSLLVRRGDFSQEAVKPIDPATGQPFLNNIIPPNRIDSVARNMLKLWPEPNVGSNIWSGAPISSNDRNQFMVRMDHTSIGGKNTLTGRYIFDEGSLLSPNGHQAVGGQFVQVPGFGVEDANRFQNLMIADTHVISANVTNEFRFSYARARVDNSRFTNPQDPSRLGFTYPVTTSIRADPATSISGVSSVGYNFFSGRVSNFYEYLDNVAVNTGKHSIKFGGDIRHSRVFSIFPSVAGGGFLFVGAITGNPLGDFLLGKPLLFLQAGGKAEKTLKQTAYSFYVQDDFRVSKAVMLNLGLRYELVPGFTEQDNALMTVVPGVQSVLGPTLPRGLVRAGDPGVPETVFPTSKHNFAPRIGIAWDPFGNGKTSIRAGYGVFYDDSALVQVFSLQQPPDLQGFNVLVFPQSFSDPYLGNSPFEPPIQFPLPVPPGGEVTFIAPDLKLGYVQHWNLAMQRQFTPSLAVEVAYVGNKGTNLQGPINPNQAVFAPGATAFNAANRRPFPQLSATYQISSIFNSSYNGLQITVTQRLSRGLSFQASYTWSKAIDDTTQPSAFFVIPGQTRIPQNSRDLRAERGLSAFDLRHRFVLSWVYELPFFREGAGAASHLLGGWRLSGIASLQSGRPFTVTDSSNPSLDPISLSSDRTNLLRDPNLPSSERTPERWFDTGAFSRFTPPNFGNAGRNIVFTDGIVNFDAGLAKDFKLGERQHLEFRWEVFNIFNHPNFGVPINDLNAPNFGRVLSTSTPERQMQFALKFLF